MTNSIKETAAALREGRRILLAGHSLPDGDSIGCVLALGIALRALGKNVAMVSEEPLPKLYMFLPGSEDFLRFYQVQGDFDTLVFLDCTDPSRSGEGLKPLIEGKRIINIDHHISNKFFGDINLIDEQASATGEIVFMLLEELELSFSQEIATCLYTAIITDTGSFQYSNTTPRTHRMAARLIEAGANAAWVNQKLYESHPLVKVKVLEKALSSLTISPSGKIAWISLAMEEMNSIGAKPEHIEGVIGFVKMIEGVEVALLFQEIATGLVKVGFRSKEFVDVNQLAGNFGGGGHPKAAGCRINGSLEEVLERVLNKAREVLGEV